MKSILIAGNWKMNMTNSEAEEFFENFDAPETDAELVFCVPFTAISLCYEISLNKGFSIGAQNMYFEDKGAFTGEISASMIKDAGAEYVILGHSERREIFKEDDLLIRKKINQAVKNNIKAILCVGENLEERKNLKYKEKIEKQILSALEDIKEDHIKEITIAYEPVWAIGTGLSADKYTAEDLISYIRDILNKKYGRISEEIRILYGGSVKAENAAELIKMPNIDGFLIGGASLKNTEFLKIVSEVSK